MKNKKMLIMLVVLLTLGVFLLCGCKKTDKDKMQTTDAELPLGVQLSEYTVIVSDSLKSNTETVSGEFVHKLSALVGKTLPIENDYLTADSGKEILIGDTNRQLSADAKALIESDGYAIIREGEKIAIVATSEIVLEDAMNYFLHSGIKLLSDGSFDVLESVVKEYSVISIINGSDVYGIAYAEDDANFNKALAEKMAQELKKMSNAELVVVAESKADNGKYIFIGDKGEKKVTEFGYCEYGVKPLDDDLLVFGWNRTSLTEACDNFVYRMERVGSALKLYCPEDILACRYDAHYFDVILPDLKCGTVETRMGGGITITYPNVTVDSFNSYETLLKDNDYEQWSKTEKAGNVFAGYRKGETSVYFYFMHDDAKLRVILEKYQELPTWDTGDICISTPTLTQFGFEYDANYGVTGNQKSVANGMLYIATLEDGSYVLVDGGRRADNSSELAKELYEYLKKNNKRSDRKIVISAWIITHGHVDHFQTFEKFGSEYGQKVELNYLFFCYPTEIELRGSENAGYSDENNENGSFLHRLDNDLKKYTGAKLYIPHTGEDFFIKDLYVEILNTYEAYPRVFINGNNCCMSFRFVFNKGQSGEASVMFPGDIYEYTANMLYYTYGSYLKSDVVQVAHHGWDNGASLNFYNAVCPNIALWSNCYKHAYASSGYGSLVRGFLNKVNPNIKIFTVTTTTGKATNTTLTFGNKITVS